MTSGCQITRTPFLIVIGHTTDMARQTIVHYDNLQPTTYTGCFSASKRWGKADCWILSLLVVARSPCRLRCTPVPCCGGLGESPLIVTTIWRSTASCYENPYTLLSRLLGLNNSRLSSTTAKRPKPVRIGAARKAGLLTTLVWVDLAAIYTVHHVRSSVH